MMIVLSEKWITPFYPKKEKKEERKKENAFSYKNKGSEGIVTHESSHNNDVQDFKQYKIHDP